MKQIDNVTLLAPGSKEPFTIAYAEGDVRDATVGDLIRHLVRNMPVERMEDAQHGVRLLDLLPHEGQEKVLNIEDADLAWLNGKVETLGPKVIGLMAARLKEALHPMSVAERKKVKEG